MAKEDWITLRRPDGRNLVVRKDAVAAFSPKRDNGDQTLVWLAGRNSEEYFLIDENEEDVARALGAF